MKTEFVGTAAWNFLDNLNEGVLVASTDGVVVYGNHAARRLLGLGRDPYALIDIFRDLAAPQTWNTLLHPPTSITMKTAIGSLYIRSRQVDVEGTELIQLLISPGPREKGSRQRSAAPNEPSGSDNTRELGIAIEQSDELTALSRVSHGLNATLELEGIFTLVLNEAVGHSQALGGEIRLWVPETAQFETQVAHGKRRSVNPTHIARVVKSEQILAIASPSPQLISPILYEGHVAGLLVLFGDHTVQFNPRLHIFIQTLANHAAIAIGNDRRFAELQQRTTSLQRRAQQIERFVESGRAFQSARPLAEVYDELVHAIQEGLGFKVVLLSLIDDDDPQMRLHRIAAAGLPLNRLREMQQTHHSWDRVAQLLKPQYALGSAYFVPAEATPEVQDLKFHHVQDLFPSLPQTDDREAQWNEEDVFFIPLLDSTGRPLGLISLDVPENGRRPDLSVAKALEIFAHQAATAVENIRLFHNMRQYAEQLQRLHDISRQVLREPDFDRKLQLIVNGLGAVGWKRVILTLRDAELNPTRLVTSGFNTAGGQPLPEEMVTPEQWRAHLNDNHMRRFRLASCYFLPADDPWVRRSFNRPAVEASRRAQPTDWHPSDLLFVPLYDRQQQVMALIEVGAPVSGRRPDSRALQTLELYAQFATAVIENSQLMSETISRSQELRSLFEASRAISSTLEPDKVLATMGDHMLEAINAPAYAIYRWHADRQVLTLALDRGPTMAEASAVRSAPPIHIDDDTILYDALMQNRPFVIDKRDENALLDTPDWLLSDAAPRVALLPLSIRNEVVGLTVIASGMERRTFRPEEMQLLTAFINQASVALENARLFEDTYQRERFYAALGRVSLAINVTLDLPSVLNLVCQESLTIFDVDGAYIWERQAEQLVGMAAQGASKEAFLGKQLSLNDSDAFPSLVTQTGVATFVNHFQENGRIRLALPGERQPKAVLGIPLKQENQIIGVMVLVDQREANRFGDHDIENATTFGVQAAIAIQNARLVTELRELNERLDERVADRTRALEEESERVRILLRITTELSASLDQDHVLNQALRLVNEVVNATQGVIMLVEPETDEMIFRAAFGLEEVLPPQGRRSGLKRHEGLAGWIIKNRTPVVVNDTHHDPRWVERATSREHRSVLAVPLVSSDEVIGVLMLFQKRPNAFTPELLDLVEAAAVQVANAISNASLYRLIRDQAERLGNMLREEQIEAAKSEAILQSIADGVLVADVDGRIVLANLPVSRILGIPRQDLVGKSVRELRGLYGASGDSWIQTIQNGATNPHLLNERSYLANQIAIEDRVVSVHVSPVFAHIFAQNQYFGTVSIIRDVTKEVEVDRMKSEFVSTVSHELRTPMTSIKGYADLMLMGAAGELAAPQTRYLKVIKNNADRLHMLVNDLLDISRIETGKTELDLQPLDVTRIIEQVVEGHLRGRIEHQNKVLTVETELVPLLPTVQGDSQRITQILTNLLDNAFNYTSEGGVIRVTTAVIDDMVAVSVSDTGIGITAENQAKIFDRFFRADDEAVQRVAGTGLGLAIVHSLVEMHGGELTIDSEPGEGSTFTFTLPVLDTSQ